MHIKNIQYIHHDLVPKRLSSRTPMYPRSITFYVVISSDFTFSSARLCIK